MNYKTLIAALVAIAAALIALGLWQVLLPLGALVVAGMAILALGVALDPSRGHWFGLKSVDTLRSFAVAGLTILVLIAIPWLAALPEDADWARLIALLSGLVLALGGTFVAARLLPPGWSALFGPAVLILGIWATASSVALMYTAGWQGLEWEPPDDGLDGTAAGIFLPAFLATVVAPIPGFVIGFLSQSGKRRVIAGG